MNNAKKTNILETWMLIYLLWCEVILFSGRWPTTTESSRTEWRTKSPTNNLGCGASLSLKGSSEEDRNDWTYIFVVVVVVVIVGIIVPEEERHVVRYSVMALYVLCFCIPCWYLLGCDYSLRSNPRRGRDHGSSLELVALLFPSKIYKLITTCDCIIPDSPGINCAWNIAKFWIY